ncbi:MAG: LysM peptidoglycan-binding domain-containing protein [Nonomuraea sp.]|nr:LysM peptidoglycan-binding domain-containing protein [Nonomuraea sp.]
MSDPNPVNRVVGAPPVPPAAASSPSRPAAGGGLAGLSRNQLYAAAAVLVAGFAALSAWRGKKTDTSSDTVTYSMDTTLTDFQGQLDQINDSLDTLKDTPKPVQPTPVTPTPPKTPTPAPKPAPPRDYVRYIVKTGDTIAKVAGAYHVSAANLYAWNKGEIDQQAASHGRKTYGTKTVIWPGSILTIKINQPGQHGVKLGF